MSLEKDACSRSFEYFASWHRFCFLSFHDGCERKRQGCSEISWSQGQTSCKALHTGVFQGQLELSENGRREKERSNRKKETHWKDKAYSNWESKDSNSRSQAFGQRLKKTSKSQKVSPRLEGQQ